jgi:hypothetical protein
MALMDWLNPLSSLTGIGSSVANVVAQQQNLNYQKWAQQQTWNREDTAVQRRAADLSAAGLSKTLAAGSAASTSSPISTSAPQIKGLQESVFAALQGMQMKKNFAQTDAQTALLKQQARSLELDNQVKEHDNKLLLDTGLMNKTPNGVNPTLMQGISIGQKWWPTIKTWWENLKNKWTNKPIDGTKEAGFGNLFKFSPKVNDFINGKWNNLTGGVAESQAVGEDSKRVYDHWRQNSNERMQEFYMNQGKNGSFGNKYR